MKILWDFDGTIMDTSDGVTRSVQYALREMGLPDDDMERIRKFIGPPLYEAFTEYYGMNDADATEAVRLTMWLPGEKRQTPSKPPPMIVWRTV